MIWNGKIVGLILGLIFGGPIGLLIGLALGHLYDVGIFDNILAKLGWQRRTTQYTDQTRNIFFETTFMMMGYIAKSDGRVSEREINYARDVMRRMGLNAQQSQEAINFFNLGKQPDFDAYAAVENLKRACWRHPSLLRNFLEIQIQLAMVDGTLNQSKRAALQQLYQQFGIRGFSFDQFEQQQRAGQQYQRYYQQARSNPRQHLNDAYTVLGIAASATDADVKKAYRRLMSKNHPDKLAAKGLPPEMVKLANEKTQQIKSAYETIKQARGMK